MPRKKKVDTESTVESTSQRPASDNIRVQDAANIFAEATRAAIEAARPVKITIANRKKNDPWQPKDGSVKLKLKRKLYHHGLLVDQDRLFNEQITLANKIRPGVYCDGYLKIIRRRDKGIDIDYPIKSQSQKLLLSTKYGVNNFTQLLQLAVDEGLKPRVEVDQEDLD